MAQLGISVAWYYLVFTALGLALMTFAAIMSHIPRIPQQRGLLAVIVIAAFTAVLSMLLTQITNPANSFEVSPFLYFLFRVSLGLLVLVALLDLFYYAQAKRRKIDGAGWSLFVGIGLLLCAALGLYSQFGVRG
ncbi:MAG TPA: hypothetical protein VIL85_26510 [Thermomicrobiales bacterium]|jgi:hypothetical protein